MMIDDSELDDIIYSPTCATCAHFIRDGMNKKACKAYPKGIPIKIWDGSNDHTKPYKGDGGIRYEPV